MLIIGLNEEKSAWIGQQWKANLPAFSRISGGQSLSVNQLVDMEWKFGGMRISLLLITIN